MRILGTSLPNDFQNIIIVKQIDSSFSNFPTSLPSSIPSVSAYSPNSLSSTQNFVYPELSTPIGSPCSTSRNLEFLNLSSINFIRPDYQPRDSPANRQKYLAQKASENVDDAHNNLPINLQKLRQTDQSQLLEPLQPRLSSKLSDISVRKNQSLLEDFPHLATSPTLQSFEEEFSRENNEKDDDLSIKNTILYDATSHNENLVSNKVTEAFSDIFMSPIHTIEVHFDESNSSNQTCKRNSIELNLDESQLSQFNSLDSTQLMSLDSTQSSNGIEFVVPNQRYSPTISIPSETSLSEISPKVDQFPSRSRKISSSMTLSQFAQKGIKVNVKRRSSIVDVNSPISSVSYSSLTPSPAVFYLMNLADSTSKLPDGFYGEGDEVGDYVLGREIGFGSFSHVYEARLAVCDSTTPSLPLAIKIVRKNQDLEGNGIVMDIIRLLDHETSIWSTLDHPGILEMIEVFEVEDAIFVVSELCEAGNLFQYIVKNGHLTESEAKSKFQQIAEAVRYLHEDKGIIHRDIKLENILLSNQPNSPFSLSFNQVDKSPSVPICKLADFGLCDWLGNPPPSSDMLLQANTLFCMGSLQYCAPEEFKSNMLKHPASDVWSLGCVLYAMLTGVLPFSEEFQPRLKSMIINARYDFSRLQNMGVSKTAQDLIEKIFKTNPDNRITIAEVLRHPWLQS
ncbi:hypothetical protein HK096_002209 [Nowakowskiella sp. JEL0078]|nr:hypothetical protein HK096_002209 [Nowakowskiella sp. JEL0078]